MFKEYSLTDNIKRDLGYIIRESRKEKFQDAKLHFLIENNPYTKENFCENNNICHYHTLTKLENEIIKEDNIYHFLLSKLDLLFQIEEEEHEENMKILDSLIDELLKAVEYLDYNLKDKIKNSIDLLNFEDDCIALKHLELIKISYELFLNNYKDNNIFYQLQNYVDFYQGKYKGLILHTLGVYCINLHDIDKAEEYCLLANEIYNSNNISKGLIGFRLIDIYILKNNYFESIKLCNEMEEYYINTKNDKRLLKIFNYLSDYYLLINSQENAQLYYDKAIELHNKLDDKILSIYMLHYNWGMNNMKQYKYEDSLRFMELAINACIDNENMLQIINKLLIIYTELKYDEGVIKDFINKGYDFFDYSDEFEQIIFRYFKYKYENPSYYRKYAIEKVIPLLKENKNLKIILLFFYEDLYIR